MPLTKKRIYLDFNASTPLVPEVAAAMRAVLEEPFGNPSSTHWAGVPGREAVEKARLQVARLLNCNPSEVVFTSGGSESNNHALKGVYFAKRIADGHVITTQVEHPAVISPCKFLETLGATVTYLAVDRYGRVDPDDVRRALTPRTILISVMQANNEVGTIQPIAEIAGIAHDHDVFFAQMPHNRWEKLPPMCRVSGQIFSPARRPQTVRTQRSRCSVHPRRG
jgi:cysteine desulfurase